MKIDEMLREVVADTPVDGGRFAEAARTRGTALRRRRRLSVLAGGGVAVAATVFGATLLLPGGGASPDVASAPGSGTTTLDGRSTAAVLAALVEDVASGDLAGYAGQGLPGGPPDTFARLELTPPGEGVGGVQVNVQGREMLRETPSGCRPSMVDCTEGELAGGDVVLTYSSPEAATPEGPFRERIVTLLSRAQGIRVSVSASNGFDLSSERWDVTRPGPVLSDAQLTAIATDPVWAFEVPAEYAEAGARLAPYDDLDVPADGDWITGDPSDGE